MAGNTNSGNRNPPKNKTSKDKEKQILSALKLGKGIRETAALTKVARNTVERIRYENAEDLPKWRKKTQENMMRVHSKLLNTLETSLDEIEPSSKNLGSVSISLGIISDKLAAIQQTGPQIVEHRHLHVNHSDVNSLLSDNQSGGNPPKQKETGQEGTNPDTKSPVIDLEPANQKESPGEASKRGGGGRANPAALDT